MNLGVGGPIDFANLGAGGGGSKILKNPGVFPTQGFFNGTALSTIQYTLYLKEKRLI